MIQEIDPDKIILCPDCDLLLEKVPVESGCRLVCPRCGCVLVSPKENSVEKTMALTVAGLLMYIPANFLPLLTFDAAGLKSTGSIWESWLSLADSGFVFTGVMVLLTSILIPLVKLLILLAVTIAIHLGRSTRATALLFRWYHHLDEWGMLEVYMIGILVTIIKMLHMAHVEYDTGFFCFIGLLSATLCSSAAMDVNLFWEEIGRQISERERLDSEYPCGQAPGSAGGREGEKAL